ncbi:hypothetical protein Dda_8189 [Drechslerella dactyloides]|uniref:MARVEL domain-containing protein n=1 Tax=Drechslerella dactyloides TaxID=74499 RepID=A0AAD6IRL0_DREDA|nr:hypothetical protein Dda_8189 [Drechslerella dactyloides]
MVNLTNTAVRGVQLFLNVLTLALAGALVAQQTIGGSPSQVNFALFASIFSMLTLFYTLFAAITDGGNTIILLAVDGLNTLFVFAAATALAAGLGVHSCGNMGYVTTNSITNGNPDVTARCHEAQALCAFLWFLFGLSYVLPTTPLKRLYYRWKALRLPWRKRYFVGMDLDGNTFWEFRQALVAGRPRRIMDFRGGRHTLVNYAEMVVDPQWHQWLRATRLEPPSIEELQADVLRRQVILERARLADERWARGNSVLDRPRESEVERLRASADATAASSGTATATSTAAVATSTADAGVETGAGARQAVRDTTVEEMEARLAVEREAREGGERKGWASGPSEEFQPAAWTPRAKGARAPR